MPTGDQKLKILYIMRLFMTRTDATHGISMPQILEHLKENGIETERKSVYRDIETLRNFGLDIRMYHRAPAEYALASREFTISELSLIVDAIQNSQFLTRHEADALVSKLKKLAPTHSQHYLNKSVEVRGRIKRMANSDYLKLDAIHEAMKLRKQVGFMTVVYDFNRKKVIDPDNPSQVVVTPLKVIWEMGAYFLQAYNAKCESVLMYRIGHMADLEIMETAAESNQVIDDFTTKSREGEKNSLFQGEPTKITLKVHRSVMGSMIDTFYNDFTVEATDDPSWGIVHLTAGVGPNLWSWFAKYNGMVKPLEPKSMVEGYKEYLRSLLDELE